MGKIIRIFVWILAAVVILVAGLFAYLRNADLSRYESQIEAFLSEKIGHDLDIGDRFELRFGRTTHLIADEVVLSSPDWDGDPVLLEVGHLSIAFNTWSILSPPFAVEELRVQRVRGRVERADDGLVNWQPAARSEKTESANSLDLRLIAFREVRVEDVQVTYTGATNTRPITLALEFLTVTPDANDILDLDLSGMVNDLPLWADGRSGPWRNFVDGRNIFSDVNISLGQAKLELNGTIEDLVQLEGVEIDGVLKGADISVALERLGLPPFASGEFEVMANVRKLDAGHQLRLDGTLGEIALFVSGNMDSLLNPQRVSHDFNITGPDSRFVAELFDVQDVPASPFQISGDYSRNGRVLTFENTLVRVGENTISLNGEVDASHRIPDGDMRVTASGPDFSVIGPFIDRAGLPRVPFTASGRVLKDGATWQADEFAVVVGENRLTINGQVESGGSNDAEIEIHATGPDISIVQDFTDVRGIPARPFDVRADIQSDPLGVEINGGVGLFGANRLEVSGILAAQPGLVGSRFSVSAQGPELQNLTLLAGVPHLPGGPFDASGGIRIDENLLYLDNVKAVVGDLTGAAAGNIGIGERLGFLDLQVALKGPDTSRLAAVEFLQDFAGDSFEAEGRISYDGDRLELESMRVSVESLVSEINGSIDLGTQVIDLSVSAHAAEPAILQKLAQLPYLPQGAVRLDGKIERSASEISFTEATLDIGEFGISAHGTLNLLPDANDSDLRFAIAGPSLAEAGKVFGNTVLPDRSFHVSGQVNGSRKGFAVREFVAKLGGNDVAGSLDVDLRDKPAINATLVSTFLDITEDLPVAQLPVKDAEQSAQDRSTRKRVFTDKPLDTSLLQLANVNLDLRIDHVIANTLDVVDVELGLNLQDGALHVDPIRLRDARGGIDGRIGLRPTGDQYLLDVSMNVDNVRLGAVDAEDRDTISPPLLSGSTNIKGAGTSIREIMASANGSISFRQGAGQVTELFSMGLFRDIFMGVLRRLNPRRSTNKYRNLECGIYDATITDGLATLENFIIQTQSMTIVARGTINLRNERLDIDFRSKLREGIGVSIGGVANEFIRLGGTLAAPSISLDAMSSVTTTGAAVATGGLSLLARGLWDRLSAEADVCQKNAE